MNFSIFFPPLPLYHLGALLMKSNTFGGNFIDPNRQFSLLLTFSGLPPYLIHTELCWLLAIENSHWARQIPFCRVIFIRNRAPGTTPHSLSCLRFLVINHRPLEHTSRSRPPFIITQPSFAVVWVYFHLTSDFFHGGEPSSDSSFLPCFWRWYHSGLPKGKGDAQRTYVDVMRLVLTEF